MSQNLPPEDHLDAHLAAVLVHGRQPTRVSIVDYDPRWPDRFADRVRYESVKRELARREWPDMNYYAAAKTAVVDAILREGSDGERAR